MWNVTSSISGSATGNLVDGSVNTNVTPVAWNANNTTRWTSGTSSFAGQYVQIDFTGTVNLSTITLDNSNDGSASDFPGTYAVYTSQDGSTFSATPVATGSGSLNQTIISFTEEAVRAIRIKATSTTSNAGLWWSIGDIQTDCNLTM
jgi:glucosylceramidase